MPNSNYTYALAEIGIMDGKLHVYLNPILSNINIANDILF